MGFDSIFEGIKGFFQFIFDAISGFFSIIFFPFSWIFAKIQLFMIALLFFIDSFTNNQALSIVLFAMLLRILLIPLSNFKIKGLKITKELQPKVDKIRERFSGDNERINREMFELYRANNFDPLTGLLGMFVEIPFTAAAFRVLFFDAFVREEATFMYWNLSQRDPYYILPLLNGFIMVLSQLIASNKRGGNNPMGSSFIGFFIAAFSIRWPVAVHLYMMVSTIMSSVQEFIISRYLNRAKN